MKNPLRRKFQQHALIKIMSVENLNVIDFVSIDKNENVVFSISDHLEWDEANEHLLILQNKINAYLSSIESGDIYKQYPNAKGKHIAINLVARYTLKKTGYDFIQRVKDALANKGYGFKLTIYKP